ncbi:MAG: 50S ribosomal protein L25 [Thermomicrobiales bacterium]
MANELTLRAEPRTVHGKKVNRLRREGLIPGVVYGPVVEGTVSVSVNQREFDKFFRNVGHSSIFTLNWDGGSQPVLIREVQVDPVTRASLHIDFFAPNMNVTLRAAVQVVLTNPSDAIEGVLQHILTEVEVEALPANLPHQIDADASGLVAVGDAVHVRDLTAPAGVTIVTDSDELIASVVAEAAQEAAESEEAAAEEAAAGAAEEAAAEEGSGE